MKILLVTPFYKPYLGGVERVVSELSKEFLQQGHEVVVITTPYSFPRKFEKGWNDKEDIEGLEVHRLRPYPHRALPFFAAPLTFFSPLKVRSILKKEKPEAVIYFGDKWFLGHFLVRLLSPRHVRHLWCPVFHDLTLLKQGLRPINWLFGRLVKNVAVVSSVEASKVCRSYGLDNSNIKIIPWGVTMPVVGADRCVRPAEKNVVSILAVGRLSHHKGQLWLADVFLEAVKRSSKKIQIFLVGGVEDYDVYDVLVKNKMDNIIIDTAANDQKLAEYYQNSDIFALFPEYESFGLVFLEAMSYGMSVLSHKVGALSEVLREGSVLVEKYDKEQAVTELVKMINDVGHRKALGEEGKAFVENNYSWDKCAKQVLCCLQ